MVLIAALSASLAHGTPLLRPELNLSIDAPAGCAWTEMPAAGTGQERHVVFTCQADASVAYQIVVFEPYWTPSAERAARFAQGVASGLQKAGWTATAPVWEAAAIPVPDCSYRYSLSATNADGRRIHVSGYQVMRGRMFAIQRVSGDAAEPAAFQALVRSFHLVGQLPPEPADPRTDRIAYVLGMVAGALVILWAGRKLLTLSAGDTRTSPPPGPRP
jgi:hypothetical protein